MKGAPALLLALLLGVCEGRNIAHSMLERSIEHTRPQLERQDGFMERPVPPTPRKQLDVHRLDRPDHELGHGEHMRMAPGGPLPPLTRDSKAVHAPRAPPTHKSLEGREGEVSIERPRPLSHTDLQSRPPRENSGKGLLDIVGEMVKPQLIKPTPVKASANQRSLREGILPPKTMTPHGMMVPRRMAHEHDEHHDHEKHDEDHHDHVHDEHHDHEKHDEEHHDHNDAGTQTQTDVPDLVKGLVASVKAKFLESTSADLKSEIQSLKTQLSAAVEAYKEAHGKDDEDVSTDAEGNTVLIIVRAPDMNAVADNVFAGTGSGADGEFTKEDWDAAVDNTQDMCAEDFETLCGDSHDVSSDVADSSDSSDSRDHHHWFRRLTGGQAPPRGPPPHGQKHGSPPPPPPAPRDGSENSKPGTPPPPPPSANSGPIGFGSRENDMCLKSQRTSASPACRLAIAQTEAIYRDLDARGMAPHPPMHIHAHGVFGLVLLFACCCCGLKCRRCRHAQKLKMKRTLAALSGNDQVKAAVEDAAGVKLPSADWKLKVALAVDANPELKSALAQVEQNYAAPLVRENRRRITNPFAGMGPARHGHCHKMCKFVLVVFGIMFFLSMMHHGHGHHDEEQERPQEEQESEEGAPPPSPMFDLLFTLSMFCFAMSCICFFCRCINKKCFGSAPAVAVNVEDEPNFVPSSVASGTVTSVTAKYVELEKGTCKI